MKTVPLVSLCTYLRSGGTPRSDNLDFYGGDIPFVTIEDMTAVSKWVHRTQKTLTQSGLDNSNCWLVPDGAIVYSIYATLGVSRLLTLPAATNQAILGLVPNREVADAEFLHYCLSQFESRISRFAGHTTQGNLSSEIVRLLPIPDFPKPQQEAIARVLSLVDVVIEQTEALLAKQQRIKTGLMHDLLTRGLDAQGRLRDPSTHRFKRTAIGEVPTDWDVVPIESLVSSTSPICYGIVQVGPHTHGGVPTIAIRDLDDIRVENLHYTERAREKRFIRSRCQGGDVLISIKATTGRIGVAPDGFNGNISRDIARVRLLPSEWPNYFKYQLQSAAGQSRLDSITVGTTRKELSIIPLRLLLVARPKPSEQEAVATRIQKSEADVLKLEDTIAKLRSLKSGLMHDLLTGLVPVTPLLSHSTP